MTAYCMFAGNAVYVEDGKWHAENKELAKTLDEYTERFIATPLVWEGDPDAVIAHRVMEELGGIVTHIIFPEEPEGTIH